MYSSLPQFSASMDQPIKESSPRAQAGSRRIPSSCRAQPIWRQSQNHTCWDGGREGGEVGDCSPSHCAPEGPSTELGGRCSEHAFCHIALRHITPQIALKITGPKCNTGLCCFTQRCSLVVSHVGCHMAHPTLEAAAASQGKAHRGF